MGNNLYEKYARNVGFFLYEKIYKVGRMCFLLKEYKRVIFF